MRSAPASSDKNLQFLGYRASESSFFLGYAHLRQRWFATKNTAHRLDSLE